MKAKRLVLEGNDNEVIITKKDRSGNVELTYKNQGASKSVRDVSYNPSNNEFPLYEAVFVAFYLSPLTNVMELDFHDIKKAKKFINTIRQYEEPTR